jgi:group I intron endonuclease
MNTEFGIVYCIECKINGLKYVGVTRQQLEQRILQHKQSSKDIKKQNRKLYSCINENGWETFDFYVLETVNLNKLQERERYWISKFNTLNEGLNSTIGGHSWPNKCRIKTYTLKSSEGKILNIENLEEFCRENNLCSSNLRKIFTGERKQSQGYSLPESNYCHNKIYELLAPNGDTVKIRNVKQFCLQNNLNYHCISNVIRGKNKSHKGYKHIQ